ncbi:MAG: ABC transporter permease [Microthrixaceae bacterium]
MSAVPLRAWQLPTQLLRELTLRELRGRFKRSTLGWLWSVINPLSNIAVYSIVFGVFFAVEPPTGEPSGLKVYAIFLVCGLLPWTFLANGLTANAAAIVANEGLVKKVYFPRWVLPASASIAWLVSFGVELLVLGLILLVAGNMVLPWIPMVLALMILLLMFVLGIGLVLAAANAFFRDIQHFLAIFLNLWFYATPILYPADLPPDHYQALGLDIPVQRLLNLNPMAAFVAAFRDVLYHLRWPDGGDMILLTVYSVVALAIGAWVFTRLEPRLAEEL